MSNKSISDIAYSIIKRGAVATEGKRAGKHVAHTKELWAEVAKELNYSKDQFEKFIGNFFTTLIRDSRFVYLDYQKENEIGVWGIKEEYSFEEFNKFQNPWWGRNQSKKYGESEEDTENDSSEESEVVVEDDLEKIIDDESPAAVDSLFEESGKKSKVNIDDSEETDGESDEEAEIHDEEDLELHEVEDLEDDEIEELEIEEEEFDELYEEDSKPKKGKKSQD